jgi:hypothetical protein
LLSFVFGSFTALARALCVDDEDEVEDVDVCAGAALEDEVSLGETVVNAGRFGTGVTGAAGAASVEDGGCGVGA